MSKGAGNSAAVPGDKLANIDNAEVDTNQQAVTLPYVAGETKSKAYWVTDTFKRFTKKVAASRGGKK